MLHWVVEARCLDLYTLARLVRRHAANPGVYHPFVSCIAAPHSNLFCEAATCPRDSDGSLHRTAGIRILDRHEITNGFPWCLQRMFLSVGRIQKIFLGKLFCQVIFGGTKGESPRRPSSTTLPAASSWRVVEACIFWFRRLVKASVQLDLLLMTSLWLLKGDPRGSAQ